VASFNNESVIGIVDRYKASKVVDVEIHLSVLEEFYGLNWESIYMKKHGIFKVVRKVVLDDLIDLVLCADLDGALALEIVEEELVNQVLGQLVDSCHFVYAHLHRLCCAGTRLHVSEQDGQL